MKKFMIYKTKRTRLFLLAAIAVFVFGLGFTNVANAQSDYQDVVYLKNGSVIRGVIIEQIPNKSIKIETADRNLFVYSMEDIEKLTKEKSVIKTDKLNNKGLKSGYTGLINFGYGLGVGDFGMDRLSFNFINGGQINPYFMAGAGFGLRYYFDAEAALIPFFVYLRGNFIDNDISPYLALKCGYTFDVTNEFNAVGLLFSPEIGVSLKIGNKTALNIGIGYEMQRMEFVLYYYYDSYPFTDNCGAIKFNIGLSF
jgi:hypothetical protein